MEEKVECGRMTVIEKLRRRYVVQAVTVIFLLSVITFFVKMIFRLEDDIVTPLIVSVAFSLIVECVDVMIWARIARNSPDSLPTFFSAVSGFRMLLALGTMLVYWLAVGREAMLVFFLVFAVFYLFLLGHHSVFFAGVSNSCDKLNNVK